MLFDLFLHRLGERNAVPLEETDLHRLRVGGRRTDMEGSVVVLGFEEVLADRCGQRSEVGDLDAGRVETRDEGAPGRSRGWPRPAPHA